MRSTGRRPKGTRILLGRVSRAVHGPSGFVAAGYAGSIAHSLDGRVWTEVSIPKYRDERYSFWELKNYDGKYYALARTVLFESADGRNWKDYPLPGTFVTMAKAGKRFAICATDSGLRTSEDLVNWTYVPGGLSALGVSSALGKMYATLWEGTLESSDGIKWTLLEGPRVYPVTGFDRGILARKVDGPRSFPFFYSADGVNWQRLGEPGRLGFLDLLYVNGRLFGIAEPGGLVEAQYFGRLRLDFGANAELNLSIESGVSGPRFQTSDDLQTWTDSDVAPGSTVDSSSSQKFFRAQLDSNSN